MSDPGVRIYGKEAAERHLRELQSGVARVDSEGTIRVGWNLPYAHGIEFGRHRNGQLARRAGGTFALTGAFQRAIPRINRVVTGALSTRPAHLWDALVGLALDVRNEAQRDTPQVSGDLRRNAQVISSRRPR